MPDVARSDSQRSDASQRPRVSFNRDVHVKRIVPRPSERVGGALSGDGAGHLVASPVRKERLKKSKKELAKEAAAVLHQADKIDCITLDRGVSPEKFYTLPNRKKKDYPVSSLERRAKRRNSLELVPPKKPPRTFATVSLPQPNQKTSIFDIFKKEKKEPKKSNIKRSVSDATNLRSKVYGAQEEPLIPFRKRSGSDTEENLKNSRSASKKQLSPIIENSPREDYFAQKEADKENIDDNYDIDIQAPARKKGKKTQSVTEQLREYIDEVDEALYKETGIRISPPKDPTPKEPEVVIIDVDKAEKISGKKSKLKNSSLGKKLKSITKKTKTNEAKNKVKNLPKSKESQQPKEIVKAAEKVSEIEEDDDEDVVVTSDVVFSPAPKIKAAIEILENQAKKSPVMIHSSQQPPEKLPLTKGRTVDTMVKRLSNDSHSPPPPKTNILITPNVTMAHNNNQPFSYTRGLSPDKYTNDNQTSAPGIIYAQVVCGKNGKGPSKQTVHTTYTNGKKHPHSDSDEGLGYEENTGFKTTTHFGDEHFHDRYRKMDYFDDHIDKSEKEESPILPKFRNPAFSNGYGYDKKFSDYSMRFEETGFIDSSSRGRGDGMDAKRRESLTEAMENGFTSTTKLNGLSNGRTDLSARRDLLESRINRRINDKSLRISPEYPNNSNVYISESTSKYYRSGSTSPVGYREQYVAESRTDQNGERYKSESRTKKYFGEHKENRIKLNGYHSFDNEPKSFDSQISDYRSSPENRHFEASHKYTNGVEKQKMFKDREIYKSTPEIHHRDYDNDYRNAYHDSLRREKHESKLVNSTKYRSERYLDRQNENERKDKFGDSGIENDFTRRDSGENYRSNRPPRNRRDYCNESEDEGFASSLLIASERQHTEDNINQRKLRRDYDSDRAYSREEDFRNLESLDYRSTRRNEYVPRERSIDDGSHYDPRIDKDIERSTLKRVDKKPPKPEKKSSLDKVKQLFTRDSKKKKEKEKEKEKYMVKEENLRARYFEYKGRDLEPKSKKKEMEVTSSYDYSNRRRLSTPSPSPTRENQRNGKSEPATTHGSWFKSLDRLSRKKTKKEDKEGNFTSTEDEVAAPSSKATPTKNLRFFGDTDLESNDSIRKPAYKSRPGIMSRGTKSQSTRDLHNISEELRTPEMNNIRKNSHKSMTNISEASRETKGSKVSLKPPISPNHRAKRDNSRTRDDRGRRRKNEVSSVESSTEGDSSQQSQRSVVYLHAATVGDIPGPGYMRNGRRAASREELASNSSSKIQPHVKTLSRSFSVLAPWKPRHYREGLDIDYTQYPKPIKNGKYEQKATKNVSSRKESSSTLKKRAQESRRANNMSASTLNRKSKSKDNLSNNLRKSKEELSRGSSSTLYKKKERLPRENTRYTRDREDKKMSSKSLSVESLGHNRAASRHREDNRDISRSVSMPRDPEKSAGWFKISKKSKTSASTHRL